MTANPIAKFYAITEATVYRWAKQGKIPSTKFQGTIRFDFDAVRAAVEGGGGGFPCMKPLLSTPPPVELLATADQRSAAPRRRPGYVEAEQFHFDDLLQIDPDAGDPPSKRKGTEADRVLAIPHSLERGADERW